MGGARSLRRKYEPITKFFHRKRRKASLTILLLVVFASVLLIMTLAAPSLHHSMVILPAGGAMWWDVSLWTVYVKSNCSFAFPLDSQRPGSYGRKLSDTCSLVVSSLDGLTLYEAATVACSLLSTLGMQGPCAVLSALGTASVIAITLYMITMLIHLCSIVLLAIFSKAIPTNVIRKALIALTTGGCVLTTLAAISYALLSGSLNQTSLSIIPFFIDVSLTQYDKGSLSTGYMMMVTCSAIHVLLAVVAFRVLKLEFCEDSDTQYRYKALRDRRIQLGYSKYDDPEIGGLIRLQSSVMDTDEEVEPLLLDDETAQREARHVIGRYFTNLMHGR